MAAVPILLGVLALAALWAARGAHDEERSDRELARAAIRAALTSTDSAVLRDAAQKARRAGLVDEATVLDARADVLQRQVQSATPPPSPSQPTPAPRSKRGGQLGKADAAKLVEQANASEDPSELFAIAWRLERGGWPPLAEAIRKRASRAMTGDEQVRFRAKREAELSQQPGMQPAEAKVRARAETDAVASQREDLAKGKTKASDFESKLKGPEPSTAHPSVPTPSQADAEKTARKAYQRAMKSTSVKEATDVVAMLRSSGYAGMAADVEDHASTLRQKASVSKDTAPTKTPAPGSKDTAPTTTPAPKGSTDDQVRRAYEKARKSSSPKEVEDLAKMIEQAGDSTRAAELHSRARDLATKQQQPPTRAEPKPAAKPTSATAPAAPMGDQERVAAIVEKTRKENDPIRLFDLAEEIRRVGDKYGPVADAVEDRARKLQIAADRGNAAPSAPTSKPAAPASERPARDYSDLPAAPVPHADPAVEAERQKQRKVAALVAKSQSENDPDRLIDMADQIRQLGDQYSSAAEAVEKKARSAVIASDRAAAAKPKASQASSTRTSPTPDGLVDVPELSDTQPDDLKARARAAYERAKKSGNIDTLMAAGDLTDQAGLKDLSQDIDAHANKMTADAQKLHDKALKSKDPKELAHVADMLNKAGFDKLGSEVAARAAQLNGGAAVSGYASPWPTLPDDAWSRFVQSQTVGSPDQVGSNGRLGQFGYSPRRLADLGLVTNVWRNSPTTWATQWAPGWSQEQFLADPNVQVQLLALDVGRLVEPVLQTCGAWIGQPSKLDGQPVTLSGLLAVAQHAGLPGLTGWLSDGRQREKFAETTRRYLRANGLF